MARTCYTVIDLGYGDAGKGSIVDALVRWHGANLVIRFNGGAQCAHNVITPDGKHHTFAQWGSGTFVPGTRTYLDRHVIVHPISLINEGDRLIQNGVLDAFERLFIHRACPIITTYQQAANHLRELARGSARHGSCGLGIGETMHDLEDNGLDILRAGDLTDVPTLRAKLNMIRARKIEECADLIAAMVGNPLARAALDMLFNRDLHNKHVVWYAHTAQRAHIIDTAKAHALIRDASDIVCEGAQGVLLDQTFGFFPYVTRSTTTAAWAHALLGEAGWDEDALDIGVMRAYQTRHGAGPFVTEDARLTQLLTESHNRSDNPWQNTFRVGWPDFVALKYALEVNGPVDALAINHLDRPKQAVQRWQCAHTYLFADNGDTPSLIAKPDHPTHDTQSNLAERITRAEAVYTMMPIETNHPNFGPTFCEYAAGELDAPAIIRGYGPRCIDKWWLKP